MYQYNRKVNNYYIYSVRLEEGQTVESYHSDTCKDVTGYSRREIMDNPYLWINMIVEEDRPQVLKHLDSVLAGGPPQTVEHRIVHKDGSVRWVENSIAPRTDDSGNLVSYYGVVRDITSIKNGMETISSVAANEKRLDERITNISNCWVQLNESGRVHVENLSIGGICLKTSECLSLNSRHNIGLFHDSNMQVASSCEVTWLDMVTAEDKGESPSYLVGFKFINMNDSEKISLMRLVNSINSLNDTVQP